MIPLITVGACWALKGKNIRNRFRALKPPSALWHLRSLEKVNNSKENFQLGENFLKCIGEASDIVLDKGKNSY